MWLDDGERRRDLQTSSVLGRIVDFNKYLNNNDGDNDEQIGSQTKILPGLGDTSASQFYATVIVEIPITDPCYGILLNMTYSVYPIYIHL